MSLKITTEFSKDDVDPDNEVTVKEWNEFVKRYMKKLKRHWDGSLDYDNIRQAFEEESKLRL